MSHELWKKRITIFVVLFLVLFSLSHSVYSNQETTKIEDRFNNLYAKWKNYIYDERNLSTMGSNFMKIENPQFKEIVDMGIQCLPFIVKQIKEEGNTSDSECLCYAIARITKYKFSTASKEELKKEMSIVFFWIRELENNTIYEHVKIRFDGIYVDRNESTIDDNEKRLLGDINDCGIFALPLAIEKIQGGDLTLLDAVNYWTDDALKKSAEENGIKADQMQEYCIKWWEANKAYWLLPPVEKEN